MHLVFKSSLPIIRSERYNSVLSCRRFVTLPFTFGSNISPKSIFVCGVRQGSQFCFSYTHVLLAFPPGSEMLSVVTQVSIHVWSAMDSGVYYGSSCFALYLCHAIVVVVLCEACCVGV
jgi:hypothetical protein